MLWIQSNQVMQACSYEECYLSTAAWCFGLSAAKDYYGILFLTPPVLKLNGSLKSPETDAPPRAGADALCMCTYFT